MHSPDDSVFEVRENLLALSLFKASSFQLARETIKKGGKTCIQDEEKNIFNMEKTYSR